MSVSIKTSLHKSKEKYRDIHTVREKWFKEYGRISSQNTFEDKRSIFQEVFNLVDVVADNKLEDIIRGSSEIDKRDSRLSKFDDKILNDPCSDFYERNDRIFCVRKNPYGGLSFYNKIKALRQAGIISRQTGDNINNPGFGIREIRNGNAHINATIMEKVNDIDTSKLRRWLTVLAQALVEMGMLDKEDIAPNHEKLRIKIGDLVCKRTYKVDALIGEGGSGRVYLGTKLNTNAKVAIKELKPSWCSEQVFAKERKILVSLQHNMIPVIYEAFDENGTYYIIMQYIDGTPLDEVYKTVTDPALALKVAIEICELVRYMQTAGKGLIHGDIKPENLIVDKAGNIHLIDFGTADSKQKTDYASGSRDYTAPELIGNGRRYLSSDVYSVGMLMSKVLFNNCVMSSSYSEELNSIIAKATSSEPQLRYQSASEMLDALRQFKMQYETNDSPLQTSSAGSYRPVYAQPSSIPQYGDVRPAKSSSKDLKVFFAIATAVVLIITAGIFLLTRNTDKEDIYSNQTISVIKDSKGLTHTVGKAKKHGASIYARIYITNTTDETVRFNPVYHLSCMDSNGSDICQSDCYLKETYTIEPEGKIHLDCVFKIEDDEQLESFSKNMISEMIFKVKAEYPKE